MTRPFFTLLLCVWFAGCSLDNDCHAPVTFHLTGHVQNSSGIAVPGDVAVCVHGDYCDGTVWGGCDPPNELGACGEAHVGKDGNFTLDLLTDSMDKNDSPRNVEVTLSTKEDKNETITGSVSSSGCGELDVLFVVP